MSTSTTGNPDPTGPPQSEAAPRTSTSADNWFRSLSGVVTAEATFPQILAGEVRTPTIPGYEILGELGRGGMGVVFQARHVALNRIVALKMVLKGAFASAGDLARFQTEAVAAAKLQHPNIVQVYDVGTLDGLPYCALEYVSGGSLDHRLQGQPQPPRDAAALVVPLARAMEAAHVAGIVHRDLKPANVLLMTNDECRMTNEPTTNPAFDIRHSSFGIPKITDFGLAKQLGSTEGLTQTGEVVGTPNYMAPEQAAGQREAVGPGADIYALGAILYEMLTGRPPFRGISAVETVLQVLTQEPVPPSRLVPPVPRDLETICLKCLHKEVGRRYLTAAALAEDLQRYLAGEPIVARPQSRRERAWRWCRRHPALAGLTAAVALLVLVLAVGGPMAAVHQARLRAEALNAEHKAEQRRQEAVVARDRARRILETLVTESQVEQLTREETPSPQQRQLLSELVPYYQEFTREAPATEAERERQGLAYDRLGRMLKTLGRRPEAQAAMHQALALRSRLAADFPTTARYRGQYAATLNHQALLYEDLGRTAEAEAAFQHAVRLFERLVAESPREPLYRQDQAINLTCLGHFIRELGRLDEAEACFQQAAQVHESLLRDFPGVPVYRRDLALTLNILGFLYAAQRRYPEAADAYRRALDLSEKLVAEHPMVGEYQTVLGESLNAWGGCHARQGRHAESEKFYRRALSVREQLAVNFPSRPAYLRDLAISYTNVASALAHQRRDAEADPLYRRARDLRTRLAEDFHALPRYRSELAHLLNDHGATLFALQRIDEAEEAYRQSLAQTERLAREHPAVLDHRLTAGGTACNLGNVHGRRQQFASALAWYDQAIAALTPLIADPVVQADARSFLRNAHAGRANTLERLDRHREAASAWGEAARIDPGSSRMMFQIYRCESLVVAGDFAQAQVELEALAHASPMTPVNLFLLARVHARAAGNAATATAKEEHVAMALSLLQRKELAGFLRAPAQRQQLHQDPVWIPLRDRPAFQQLLLTAH